MTNDSLVMVNEYLPVDYDLTLIVGDKPNFQGELTINLEGIRDGEFNFVVHGHKLVILQALLDGETLAVTYDKPQQTITLTGHYHGHQPGKLAVTIKYMGSIQVLDKVQQTRGMFKSVGDEVIISTQCQPIFARQILPIIDESHVKIPLTLTIKTQRDKQVIANMGVDYVEHEGDFSIHHFKQTPPILPSSIGFTIGDLSCKEITTCSVPIKIWGSSLDINSKAASLIANSLQQLFPLIQSHLGPYPLDKLDIIGIPYLTEGAMENWGMITVMKDHLFKGHELHIKQLLSHELIHQWLGNLVSFDDWKFLWLNESLATILGNYFVSLLDGNDEAFKLELININQRLNKSEFNQNIQKFMNNLLINNDITTTYLFNHNIYERGIVIIRMLINLISDNIDDFPYFLKVLHKFIDLNKFTSIKPLDLWKFIDQEVQTNGNNVDILSFISIWIRYDKFPSLQINELDDELIIEQMQSKNYHFPLVLKTQQDFKKLIITEKITKVKINHLLVINQDKISLIKSDISKKIIKNIDISKLNKLDANVYLLDYERGEFNKKLQTHVNNL